MKKQITDDVALAQELVKYRKYCKCGHSVIITEGSGVNKIICTHCGKYIYKNEKEKFKELLKSEERKLKNGKR